MAGVGGPGAGRVQVDVGLPVFAGFRDSTEFFADEGEIVVGVGVARIETHGLAQVAAGFFELAYFFKDAAEIVLG